MPAHTRRNALATAPLALALLTACETIESAGEALGRGVDKVNATVAGANEKVDETNASIETVEAKTEQLETNVEEAVEIGD